MLIKPISCRVRNLCLPSNSAGWGLRLHLTESDQNPVTIPEYLRPTAMNGNSLRQEQN
jgi:hypothetical protein